MSQPKPDLNQGTTDLQQDLLRGNSRVQWNTASLIKHYVMSGNQTYILQAEDTLNSTGQTIRNDIRLVAIGMTIKQTGNMAERVEPVIGMKAMVIHNIVSEADIANRTRGEVTDTVFDTREHLCKANKDGTVVLQYPPALILFKPEIKPTKNFKGLPEGIIPIAPHKATFCHNARQKIIIWHC